jgi:hypothetical protein
MARPFGFPNPVNETAARTVAAGVLAQALVFLVTAVAFGWWWGLVPLTFGFVARVTSGPTFSPLGRFATRVAAPALERRGVVSRLVPGPPKRFAQAVGVVFTVGASVAWAIGWRPVAIVLIVGLSVAATLESVFALCLGCMVFNRLMRWGVIPERVCEECADISRRLEQRVPSSV